MTRNESTPTKRLTANDVYELTSEVLQEYFELDMSSSEYEANDIWDVLVTAAVQQTTVETACGLFLDSLTDPTRSGVTLSYFYRTIPLKTYLFPVT
jgi:hypothetical protein